TYEVRMELAPQELEFLARVHDKDAKRSGKPSSKNVSEKVKKRDYDIRRPLVVVETLKNNFFKKIYEV
ncbi:hypothetical protein KI387_034343, partial [Taxus chinensis]